MKTIETTLYSFKELSKEAQKKVISDISDSVWEDSDISTLEECLDSLKAICEYMGMPLVDWSVGSCCYCSAKVKIPYCMEENMSGGNKTIAIFLKNLIEKGYPRPKRFSEMEFTGICGFTGMCYDDDMAETIYKSLLSGNSFDEAINNAAKKIGNIAYDDLVYRASEEGILEYLDQDEEIYTKNGEEF